MMQSKFPPRKRRQFPRPVVKRETAVKLTLETGDLLQQCHSGLYLLIIENVCVSI